MKNNKKSGFSKGSSNLNKYTLYNRINLGWTIEKTIETPIRRKK